QMANASYNLYLQLWQPLQKHITNKRIVIIPDANIYHISFDLLTTQLAHSNEEITQHCLLQLYAFSYNYSLLALTQQRNQSQFSKNFIGFAPEFTDHQKNKY